MNLAARFAETARRSPQRIAVAEEAGSCTYGDLLAAAQAVAAQVRATTDRRQVAVLAPTSSAFAVAYFGTLLADRVAVPLNFLLDAKTLGFLASDAGVDTVVASRCFEALAASLGTKTLFVEEAAGRPAEPLAPTASGDDPATILYTSGTTGVPKGAILTHRNLVRNVESCLDFVGITGEDVLLGILPLFHSFGLTTSLLIPLLSGCSAACVAGFSPQRVFEAIARRRATVCFAVASMYRALLRAGPAAGLDLGSLRLVLAGGEALGAPLATRFEEVFGLPLFEGYGLTETSPVVAVNLPGRCRPGSVGQMLDWADARIVDDAGTALPPGQDGELWLRGDCITPGYHNRPEETAAALTPDGWFRTGDLARIDADGFLWITGRKKDLIISGGENISPNEIEAVLAHHPAVHHVAVIGVPDATRGEVPRAFVVLAEGQAAEPGELAAFCRQRLPRYKVPARFEFRDELPRSPTGKVHKLALRQQEGLA